ncbi:MAG: molybdopterin-synthase adenylyltransferase MoeB [Rhodospirillales bacterium]|nr:molybdopterin-synthase adenylyltransferase MoeB [Rhodospirillales bacterium]
MDDQELKRYARHILLPEIGGPGQARLLGARVLVIGAGGLGSPVILYLAAAGIGTIGIIDDDEVDLSNLQRQVVHTTARIGAAKTESARQAVAAINPGITVNLLNKRLTRENAAAIIAEYDIVADGSDNFETRFLVNDACYFGAKTLVSAALLRFDGQLSTFRAHLGGENPCYRCIFGSPPPPETTPSCAETGVLGALAGAMGSLQAIEVVKELLDVGESLSGSLVIFDALSTTFRKVHVPPDPACRLCGPQPTITDLSIDHGTPIQAAS